MRNKLDIIIITITIIIINNNWVVGKLDIFG